MQIYRTSCKEEFLEEVANYILNNFSERYYNLKVIMPSGFICIHLQKLLIKKIGATILPEIIPISEIAAESEEVFNIPSKKIGVISKIEEKIILSHIIYSYQKLNYTLPQSIRLASSLSSLFFEFESNDLTINALQNIPLVSEAMHWQAIYDFLIYADNAFQEELIRLAKLSRASHHKIMLQAELQRLQQNTDSFCIAAGIMSNNEINHQFIAKLAKLPNGYIILPPIVDYDKNDILNPEDGLFNIVSLLKKIDIELINISYLSNYKTSLLDQLLLNNPETEDIGTPIVKSNLEYFICENIFTEAQFIAHKCSKILHQNPESTITIVINALDLKDYYTNALYKFSLPYHDLIGYKALKTNIISLLLIIADNVCNNFSMQNFIALLTHPLVNDPKALIIKKSLIKNHRFANSLTEMQDLMRSTENEENIAWLNNICHIIKQHYPSKANLEHILREIIKAAEALYPDIWHGQFEQKISISLSELLETLSGLDNIEKFCNLENRTFNNIIQDFPEILKEIMENSYLSTEKPNCNITLCRHSDTTLINSDLIIISGMNEGILPLPTMNSPWINKHMQSSLKVTSWSSKYGQNLYEFYLNLHNKHVILTRAKKHSSDKELLTSSFILRLSYILGQQLLTYHVKTDKVNKAQDIILLQYNSNTITSPIFPNKISASDFELLVRAPYNFYAKKILNLKKDNKLEDEPTLAEFGSFFHLVIENYTKLYEELSGLNKNEELIKISDQILDSAHLPIKSRKLWKIKIAATIPDFIEFDESRRKSARKIFSELKGSMDLIISGHKVTINAIADRVEIDHNNKAIILDYKTGALPSKKDILSGLSPQLIIYALIMLDGGFGIRAQEIKNLVYVKISSTKPYIETTEYAFSIEDLKDHKNAIIQLLQHYIETGQYQIEYSNAKYDDYLHLARRS